MRDTVFVDVIIPLPIPKLYTYRVPHISSDDICVGSRVVVPFGKKNRLYTAIVRNVHNNPPVLYHASYIQEILDNSPIVHPIQLDMWEWMSYYYMANPGDVMQAALPSGFKISSESRIILHPGFIDDPVEVLTDDEYIFYEAVKLKEELVFSEIDQFEVKEPHKVVKELIGKKVVLIREVAQENYQPKKVSYIFLNASYQTEDAQKEVLDSLQRAPKQQEVFMAFLQLWFQFEDVDEGIKKMLFQKQFSIQGSHVAALAKKGILRIEQLYEDRIPEVAGKAKDTVKLSDIQQNAFREIKESFDKHNVTLLHGVTSSGKTAIYMQLIQEVIEQGKQVLFLVPEIALTTQLVGRFKRVFHEKVGVYHSKFSNNERVEIWNEVLHFDADKSDRYQMMMGARSALFLPFKNLGLVVIDEEHEMTFKQLDPAPRYHARDTALVLANMHKAKVLLGSATPSVESYWNTQHGKYGLVTLDKRYGGVLLPEVLCADIKEDKRKKRMKGLFSPLLIEKMESAFKAGEQVILFQNRRGYAPILTCNTCGHSPECSKCDVTLTYHKYNAILKCHYCGLSRKAENVCLACGSSEVSHKGFGTEQVVEEVEALFPKIRTARMDLDTTRKKHAHREIIESFESGQIDLLVGTQMVTKGLDFKNVSVVGIMNADALLSFPDFRAYERAFQLMAQVSGRAGRQKKRGTVIVQTYEPYNRVIQQVMSNNYSQLFQDELLDRKEFDYPPFYRIIRFYLTHKNVDTLNQGAKEFSEVLQGSFKDRVLGPTFPHVMRVNNQYRKHIQLKLERELSIKKVREVLNKNINYFKANSPFKSVRIKVDVDPM